MKKKLLFLLLVLPAVSLCYSQGVSHPQYVTRQSAVQAFSSQYALWQPGASLYSDAASEDEEFFISRVRPKQRFANSATQVNTALDGKRKMFWWCPIGEAGWNAIPTYYFNSDVFSMWSYVDHYGNWTAPTMRQVGAFMDVCHKNGVANSVTCQPAWAANVSPTSDENGKTMQALINGGADKYLKFLRYYGIDGLGFNSEFNFSTQTFANSLNTLFQNASKKKDAAGVPNYCMAWYSLTGNSGSITSPYDALHSGNQNWFNNGGSMVSNYFFLNYNWNSSYLSSSQTLANSFAGRSSYDVFAGMDLQGRSSTNWTDLQNYNISIGIWGAHNMNMPFESRGELGSEPMTQQQTYQKRLETFFTGSSHNPVNSPAVSNILGYSANLPNFHGISKFLTARSTLQTTDLAKEPFVTYFNLGNGKFFNFRGVTTFPNEWYNIGMQDYLPTWRWWLASSFLGRTAASVPSAGVTPVFTWEDAWFGGSCLKVSGQTTAEYLHLFKTRFPLQDGDKITVRYKIRKGSGDVRLSCSAEGTESTEVNARIMRSSEMASDAWVEKVVTVGASTGQLNLGGKTLAMMALKFENTSSDFSVLFGEISLKRTVAATPAMPTITKSKFLAANYKGVDFKLIFKMMDRNPSKLGVPIYNDTVNTWYFKIYSQQKNEEPVLCTATTSWASYVVGAPFNSFGEPYVRFGVSAVSLDGESESPVAWTDYKSVGTLAIVEGIEMDKPVVNPSETFTIKYKDPNHAPANKWEIFNSRTGVSVQSFTSAKSISTSLPDVGPYDLTVTDNKGTATTYRGYIQVVSTQAGSVPHINTLTANASSSPIAASQGADVAFAYTAKNSDGSVSKALRLPEKAFCIRKIKSALNLTVDKPGDATNGLTLSFWFKPVAFNHQDWGTQLVNICDSVRTWPFSAWGWGYFWMSYGSKFTTSTPYPGFHIGDMFWYKNDAAGTYNTPVPYEITPYIWYHMAITITANQDIYLFMNGRLIQSFPKNETSFKDMTASDNLFIGGNAFKRAGFDGYIDEVKIYNKALKTEAEIQSTMNVLDNPSSVANLVGYWNFETDAVNGVLPSLVGNVKARVSILNATENTTSYQDATTVAYGSSTPSVTGNSYSIVTQKEWKLDGAIVTQQPSFTAESGSVAVKYLNNGLYRATVKLTNDWGSDSKTFEFVKVGGTHTVNFSIDPGNIHPNNVKLYYANVGSTSYEPVVSGESYPDGVTLKLVAKPVTLDGTSNFSKWIINGVDNSNATVEMTLDADKIILASFVPSTGLFSPSKAEYNFKVAPNPFVNEVNVQFVKDGRFTIEVVSTSGQVILSQHTDAKSGEFRKIAVTGGEGMYLINIKEKGQLLKTLKVLKK